MALTSLPFGVDAAQFTGAPLQPVFIDDGDAAYSETSGAWFTSSLPGADGDSRFSGSADAVATWSFGLLDGTVQVAATWPAHPNSATAALFVVACDGEVVGCQLVDQTVDPMGYKALGDFAVNGDVVVSAYRLPGSSGNLRADSIRIENTVGGTAFVPSVQSFASGTTQYVLWISNITDAPVDVVFTTYAGGLIYSPPANAITPVNVSNYVEGNGPTASFTIAPNQTGSLVIRAPQVLESWGTISWTQTGNADVALLAHATSNSFGPGTDRERSISVNGGLPF